MKYFFAYILSFSIFCFNSCSDQIDINSYLNNITNHFVNNIDSLNNNSTKNPRSLNEDETIRFVKSNDWTSGFFPGTLWQLYSYSNNNKLKQAAIKWTKLLEKEQYNNNDHDIGFRVMCSFGQGYKINKSDEYKNIILQSAKTLATRFDSKIGAIKSWNSNNGKWNYPVIIDNMMNLELLFKATELTSDSSYYKIAIAHANTTLNQHYRNDCSSIHVVDFDSSTGKVLRKVTHQGYADSSAWARGQAWGLYGFTMTYRFTNNAKYLNHAVKIAEFLMGHSNLPEDLIPYWDFNDPNIPNALRDVSAASIISSALYELSKYKDDYSDYIHHADKIIININNKYLLNESNKPFYTTSSVGNYNKNSEVNVPINYADYYLIEALIRRLEISNEL